MNVFYELDLDCFEAWGGGEETLSRILEEGMKRDFLAMLESCYPEGIDETELNDLLRFEEDWIFSSLGIKTDEEKEEEARDREERLDNAVKAETFAEFCACFSDCDDCPLFGEICGEDSYKKWKEENQ